MTLTNLLINTPLRETAGSRTQQRFDYQAQWALTLLFLNHSEMDDYAIVLEFHDDLLLLDNSYSPEEVTFFQVKTKGQGHWTMADLFRRSKSKKDSTKELPSAIGKLLLNIDVFSEFTNASYFVSNVPCNFLDANQDDQKFIDCEAKKSSQFRAKVLAEIPATPEDHIDRLRFLTSNLSLKDGKTHLKGKLINFLDEQSVSASSSSLSALLVSILEECRSRSACTDTVSDLAALVQNKAITKSDVDTWLNAVRAQRTIPSWTEVQSHFSTAPMKSALFKNEWEKYCLEALDQGNEAVNQIRRLIRSKIIPNVDDSASAKELLDYGLSVLVASTEKIMPGMSPERLSVMIIYEVYSNEPTSELQTPHSKPAEEKS